MAGARLQQLLSEADGDDAGRAAHAAEAVADNVASHLEVIDDQARQAGRRAVQRAVGDQDVDLRSGQESKVNPCEAAVTSTADF
jgi:hypothetical protein